jgi:hypothetical protein
LGKEPAVFVLRIVAARQEKLSCVNLCFVFWEESLLKKCLGIKPKSQVVLADVQCDFGAQ